MTILRLGTNSFVSVLEVGRDPLLLSLRTHSPSLWSHSRGSWVAAHAVFAIFIVRFFFDQDWSSRFAWSRHGGKESFGTAAPHAHHTILGTMDPANCLGVFRCHNMWHLEYLRPVVVGSASFVGGSMSRRGGLSELASVASRIRLRRQECSHEYSAKRSLCGCSAGWRWGKGRSPDAAHKQIRPPEIYTPSPRSRGREDSHSERTLPWVQGMGELEVGLTRVIYLLLST